MSLVSVRFFAITVYYYNPNIYPESEYYKRVKEQERLIKSMPLKNRSYLSRVNMSRKNTMIWLKDMRMIRKEATGAPYATG